MDRWRVFHNVFLKISLVHIFFCISLRCHVRQSTVPVQALTWHWVTALHWQGTTGNTLSNCSVLATDNRSHCQTGKLHCPGRLSHWQLTIGQAVTLPYCHKVTLSQCPFYFPLTHEHKQERKAIKSNLFAPPPKK